MIPTRFLALVAIVRTPPPPARASLPPVPRVPVLRQRRGTLRRAVVVDAVVVEGWREAVGA